MSHIHESRALCRAGMAVVACLLLPSHASASEAPLVIPVTVAVDDTFRADPAWGISVGRAFAGANERIGAPLRIRFKVERRAAWRPSGSSLDAYLERLREQVGARHGGAVIGLTRHRPEPRHVFGATSYVDALTVLSVPVPGAAWDRELAHELGHILGAIHVEGEDVLMARQGRGLRLDTTNARLMALHRDRRFPPSPFPLREAQLDAAARLYHEAARRAPAGANRALIHVERARGDLRAALRAAEELVAVRPDGLSLELRARVLADLGRLDESATALHQSLAIEPRRAQALHDLAILAERSGRRAQAVEMHRRALQLEPDNAPALADLARLLLESGKVEEALHCARRALRLQPGLQAARVNLAAAHLAAGGAQAAEAEARRAVEMAPESFEAHEVLAHSLLAAGRAEEAVTSLEEAARRGSGDAERMARLGVAFEQAGRLARARQAIEAALKVDPLHARALAARGRLRLRDGDPAGAAEDLRRAVEVEAGMGSAWSNLAAANLQLGRLRQAEEAAREGLRRAPRSAEAMTTLALALHGRGDLEGALELQERAAELVPDDPGVLMNLGTMQAQADRRSSALQTYLRFLELRPDDGSCHNDVAVLYFREGCIEDARRHAARALALGAPVSPDFLAALQSAAAEDLRVSAR